MISSSLVAMTMAMAPQGQAQAAQHERERAATADTGSIDNLRHMALTLFAILATALGLTLAFEAAMGYLADRSRRARRSSRATGSGSGSDPEKLAVVYSAASASSDNLAGAAAECAICLTDFADGDAVRVMPACRHGFHASCIERWLDGGRRSSCPTCRAPAAAAPAAAAAAQPEDEATDDDRREPYSVAADCARRVVSVILALVTAVTLTVVIKVAIMPYLLGRRPPQQY